MQQGLTYLNQGKKCLIRLLISLYTLRRHYKGPVTVIQVGDPEAWFKDALTELNASILQIPNDGMAPLVRKAHLWQVSPYDCTMFLDADTVVTGPIDEYFERIREYGFATGWFAGWETRGHTMSKRIRAFKKVCPEYVEPAVNYGKATNTGIFGFMKGDPFLKEWAELTVKAYDADVSRIPDEVSCQMLLPRYRHWMAPVAWGVSVKHGDQPSLEDVKIFHFHGRKHCHPFPPCTLWKSAFWEYFYKSPASRQKELFSCYGDRRLARYLRGRSLEVTVVTAVDRAYLPSLKANFPKWMRTEGLIENRWICYYNGVTPEDLAFMDGRAKLIPWNFPAASSQRENMLTAFVLGTARDVETEYWIKIDSDVKPMDIANRKYDFRLEFPRKAWHGVLAGHKWNYTKPGSFLVDLERWAAVNPAFAGTKPVFKEDDYPTMLAAKRYGHPRIASYICLHKSEFVRRAAAAAGARLPVPSHDSYLFYCAARWGLPIARLKFKPHFIP